MEIQEPSIKKQRVDENENVNRINKLPILAIEIILDELSVTDRLRMGRVDCFWNETVRENGWNRQKKLSFDVVFGGAERVRKKDFTDDSLIALFKLMGNTLTDLNLRSFFHSELSVTAFVCDSLPLLPKLRKIDFWFNLSAAVPFLPVTLREIRFSKGFRRTTLMALAAKCPHLEAIEIVFDLNQRIITVSCINEFLANYPRLKKLRLGCSFLFGSGKLTPTIAKLKELEEFKLFWHASAAFDDETFGALIENCKNLKRLGIYGHNSVLENISERAFCGLAKLPNLTELVLPHTPNITAIVLETIDKKCQNLKEFKLLK